MHCEPFHQCTALAGQLDCSKCDGHVDKELLSVFPDATICLECLEETEKRQLETDLRMTQEVNRSLLPRFDLQTSSWEVGIHYKSSRILSGDYYDVVFDESKSTITLTLGDVVGKGLPAALLRTSLQATMRALSAEETPPSKLLEKANQQYSLVAHPGRFATAFYAVANGDHSMVFANGGHLPPLLKKASGPWERLDPTGPVLGLFDSVDYENCSCTVEPGDILILYTDGVTESRNPAGEFFDEEGIIQAVEKLGGTTAQDIARLLGEELDRFTLGLIEDDQTLLVVRRV